MVSSMMTTLRGVSMRSSFRKCKFSFSLDADGLVAHPNHGNTQLEFVTDLPNCSKLEEYCRSSREGCRTSKDLFQGMGSVAISFGSLDKYDSRVGGRATQNVREVGFGITLLHCRVRVTTCFFPYLRRTHNDYIFIIIDLVNWLDEETFIPSV
jgi:hypothetical protein